MTTEELRAEISRRRQVTKSLIADLDAEIANTWNIVRSLETSMMVKTGDNHARKMS